MICIHIDYFFNPLAVWAALGRAAGEVGFVNQAAAGSRLVQQSNLKQRFYGAVSPTWKPDQLPGDYSVWAPKSARLPAQVLDLLPFKVRRVTAPPHGSILIGPESQGGTGRYIVYIPERKSKHEK